MPIPTNTENLGLNFRGRAWNDGTPITRVPMTDGSNAEGVAALQYVWNGTIWVAAPGDALFSALVASNSGATTVIPAVANKSIRVVSYVVVSSGAVNVKFQSHVTPTDLSGLFYLVANTGVSSSYVPAGHFQSVTGEALDINLSAGVPVGGHLTYLAV